MGESCTLLVLEVGNVSVTKARHAAKRGVVLAAVAGGCVEYGVKSGATFPASAASPGEDTHGASVDSGEMSAPSDPREPDGEEPFSYGWHILDEGEHVPTLDPAHPVTTHGDVDGFWYEPSGYHALMGSADREADFESMRDYVLARVPEPNHPMGNLHYYADSTLRRFEEATYTYVLADFMLGPADDVNEYRLGLSAVDDGLLVLVNGHQVGGVTLDEAGQEWALGPYLRLAERNTLIVILMDNDERNKFIQDMAFFKGDIMVVGGPI